MSMLIEGYQPQLNAEDFGSQFRTMMHLLSALAAAR